MRFAILTNAFPPDGQGGAERSAFLQADALACLGHDVRVWAPDRGVESRGQGPGAATRTVIHGMEVIRFPAEFSRLGKMSRMERLRFHLVTDAAVRKDVAEGILAWKPDVLLTHNLTGCGLGTAAAVQAKNVRWVHTLHDIQLTDPSGRESVAFAKTQRARWWRSFWSWRRRLVFGKPNVMISPTDWLLDWHRRAGFKSTRVTVIPNPVDSNPPRDRALRLPATIAYVGRLSEEKGFDIFLEVLKRLDASVIGKAIVVGGGHMLPQAERLLDRRLLLRGAMSFEDARRAIAEADVLIAPSQILENQQTILLEAMAEGTPAIATAVGGTRETLEGTECPLIPLDDEQVSAFIENTKKILSSSDEWEKISSAMRERATRHEKERYFDALMSLV